MAAKKKWIQQATETMRKKGTVGSFKRYCGGKVTQACIDRAKKSGNTKLVKKAVFAENVIKASRSRKKGK